MATYNAIFQNAPSARPCWVDGRRAMFHRWTDSARPVKPRGMEDADTTDRFQVHSVHALVEYEDGTMERVWPNTVRFAFNEEFGEYDWETMEHLRDEMDSRPPITPNDCIKITHAEPSRTCLTCGNKPAKKSCNVECYACDAGAVCKCFMCTNFCNWTAMEAHE